MIYKPVSGSRLSQDQAQKYGEAINTIIEGNNGQIDPEDIVEKAKRKNSPLNDFFEWDDEKAANNYRVDQARYLLRSIEVVILRGDTEMNVRAFHNVKIVREDDIKQTFANIEEILSKDELYQQILGQAIKQLESWKNKYSQYKELKGVFDAIENLSI